MRQWKEHCNNHPLDHWTEAKKNIAGIASWTMDGEASVVLIVQPDHSKEKDLGSLRAGHLDVIIQWIPFDLWQ